MDDDFLDAFGEPSPRHIQAGIVDDVDDDFEAFLEQKAGVAFGTLKTLAGATVEPSPSGLQEAPLVADRRHDATVGTAAPPNVSLGGAAKEEAGAEEDVLVEEDDDWGDFADARAGAEQEVHGMQQVHAESRADLPVGINGKGVAIAGCQAPPTHISAEQCVADARQECMEDNDAWGDFADASMDAKDSAQEVESSTDAHGSDARDVAVAGLSFGTGAPDVAHTSASAEDKHSAEPQESVCSKEDDEWGYSTGGGVGAEQRMDSVQPESSGDAAAAPNAECIADSKGTADPCEGTPDAPLTATFAEDRGRPDAEEEVRVEEDEDWGDFTETRTGPEQTMDSAQGTEKQVQSESMLDGEADVTHDVCAAAETVPPAAEGARPEEEDQWGISEDPSPSAEQSVGVVQGTVHDAVQAPAPGEAEDDDDEDWGDFADSPSEAVPAEQSSATTSGAISEAVPTGVPADVHESDARDVAVAGLSFGTGAPDVAHTSASAEDKHTAEPQESVCSKEDDEWGYSTGGGVGAEQRMDSVQPESSGDAAAAPNAECIADSKGTADPCEGTPDAPLTATFAEDRGRPDAEEEVRVEEDEDWGDFTETRTGPEQTMDSAQGTEKQVQSESMLDGEADVTHDVCAAAETVPPAAEGARPEEEGQWGISEDPSPSAEQSVGVVQGTVQDAVQAPAPGEAEDDDDEDWGDFADSPSEAVPAEQSSATTSGAISEKQVQSLVDEADVTHDVCAAAESLPPAAECARPGEEDQGGISEDPSPSEDDDDEDWGDFADSPSEAVPAEQSSAATSGAISEAVPTGVPAGPPSTANPPSIATAPPSGAVSPSATVAPVSQQGTAADLFKVVYCNADPATVFETLQGAVCAAVPSAQRLPRMSHAGLGGLPHPDTIFVKQLQAIQGPVPQSDMDADIEMQDRLMRIAGFRVKVGGKKSRDPQAKSALSPSESDDVGTDFQLGQSMSLPDEGGPRASLDGDWSDPEKAISLGGSPVAVSPSLPVERAGPSPEPMDAVNGADLQQLLSMGFPEGKSRDALINTDGQLQAAVALLLATSSQPTTPVSLGGDAFASPVDCGTSSSFPQPALGNNASSLLYPPSPTLDLESSVPEVPALLESPDALAVAPALPTPGVEGDDGFADFAAAPPAPVPALQTPPVEGLPGDDGFADFAATPPAPVPALQTPPLEGLPGDDGFADFAATPPAPVPALQTPPLEGLPGDDGFADFAAAPPAAVPALQTPPVEGMPGDDGFADFAATPPAAVPALQTPPLEGLPGDDGFADFAAAPPATVPALQTPPVEGLPGDDGFADFAAAPPAPVPALQTPPVEGMPGDDGFADFAATPPAAVPALQTPPLEGLPGDDGFADFAAAPPAAVPALQTPPVEGLPGDDGFADFAATPPATVPALQTPPLEGLPGDDGFADFAAAPPAPVPALQTPPLEGLPGDDGFADFAATPPAPVPALQTPPLEGLPGDDGFADFAATPPAPVPALQTPPLEGLPGDDGFADFAATPPAAVPALQTPPLEGLPGDDGFADFAAAPPAPVPALQTPPLEGLPGDDGFADFAAAPPAPVSALQTPPLEGLPGDDGFADFAATPPAPVPALQTPPLEGLPGDDGFADFAAAPPATVPALQTPPLEGLPGDDGFADFAATPPAPVPALQTPPLEGLPGDDGFADFAAAPPATVPALQTPPLEGLPGDDGFADFAAAPPAPVPALQTPPLEGLPGDDGFADFAAAPPAPVPALQTPPLEGLPGDDGFADFAATAPAPVPALQTPPLEGLPGDDGFADFAATPPAPVPALQTPPLEGLPGDDGFADFAATPPAPVPALQTPPLEGLPGDDGFADFAAAPPAPVPALQTPPLEGLPGDDGFADFAAAPPAAVPALQTPPLEGLPGDDGFADFAAAPPATVPAVQTPPLQAADQDDDFADFEEAPTMRASATGHGTLALSAALQDGALSAPGDMGWIADGPSQPPPLSGPSVGLPVGSNALGSLETAVLVVGGGVSGRRESAPTSFLDDTIPAMGGTSTDAVLAPATDSFLHDMQSAPETAQHTSGALPGTSDISALTPATDSFLNDMMSNSTFSAPVDALSDATQPFDTFDDGFGGTGESFTSLYLPTAAPVAAPAAGVPPPLPGFDCLSAPKGPAEATPAGTAPGAFPAFVPPVAPQAPSGSVPDDNFTDFGAFEEAPVDAPAFPSAPAMAPSTIAPPVPPAAVPPPPVARMAAFGLAQASRSGVLQISWQISRPLLPILHRLWTILGISRMQASAAPLACHPPLSPPPSPATLVHWRTLGPSQQHLRPRPWAPASPRPCPLIPTSSAPPQTHTPPAAPPRPIPRRPVQPPLLQHLHPTSWIRDPNPTTLSGTLRLHRWSLASASAATSRPQSHRHPPRPRQRRPSCRRRHRHRPRQAAPRRRCLGACPRAPRPFHWPLRRPPTMSLGSSRRPRSCRRSARASRPPSSHRALRPPRSTWGCLPPSGRRSPRSQGRLQWPKARHSEGLSRPDQRPRALVTPPEPRRDRAFRICLSFSSPTFRDLRVFGPDAKRTWRQGLL